MQIHAIIITDDRMKPPRKQSVCAILIEMPWG
jgi:hypothetical protein